VLMPVVLRPYLLFYASAIAHSAFRDQPRRRRPRPNENCPLRMRCASSMPAIVMVAFANDLNPAIDAQRRLIVRWSCSMRLLRYFVRPDFHVAPAGVLASQKPQRSSTRHVSVERHFAWHARKRRRERFAEERLRGRDSAVAPEKKVNGVAVLVDGAIQVDFALIEM
jgi:hypothetical protein